METVPVRAIQIPKKQIKEIEDEFGAKLVSDFEPFLLLSLDQTLEDYRKAHFGSDPDIVELTNFPGEFFKHMVINIDFLGMSVPGSANKPAWFRFKKFY